jgi:hypothetical protein
MHINQGVRFLAVAFGSATAHADADVADTAGARKDGIAPAACSRAKMRGSWRTASAGRWRSSLLGIGLASLHGLASGATPQNATASDAAAGFENPAAWSVSGNGSSETQSVSASSTRTQGNAALRIDAPANLVKITSPELASTASALAGIGDKDALLRLDILIPEQSGNARNRGSVAAFLSAPSRGLANVRLSKVDFNDYRPGSFQTVAFAIPESATSVLGAAAFNDLRVEFQVSSPGKTTGAYLFDNLRVHSATAELSQDAPPPGYGGSIDLVVFGDKPATAQFDLGPVQIPAGFHLKKGSAGVTTVTLKLGLDAPESGPACIYHRDMNDASAHSYVFGSCTGGLRPGDLISANTAQLSIDGGDASQKIRAQLALRPLGDMLGADLLPAMPTFWGDADTCVPAPSPGAIVTLSASCEQQMEQANQILSDYFARVNNTNIAPGWVVTPTPEHARRHGDGSPVDLLQGPPPTPTDPPFDTGGHLNDGGSFDAYWRLNGTLDPSVVPDTDQTKTHFDATFSTHGVVFGHDVDVVDINLVTNADSGRTVHGTQQDFAPSSYSGEVRFYVFGQQVPGANYTFDPHSGFSVDKGWDYTYDLPPIRIWLFKITVGVEAAAQLQASGSASPAGVNFVLTPTAKFDAHAFGGIDVLVASGGVDTRVNLISVATPVSAQAHWQLDTTVYCRAYVNGGVKGDFTLSSGGGKVSLVATFGICPFCDKESHTVYEWHPLASYSRNLFDLGLNVSLFNLPQAACNFPLTASIDSPASGAIVPTGVATTLRSALHSTDPTTEINLPTYPTQYHWTLTPADSAASFSGNLNSANPVITFAGPDTDWTLNLSATVTTPGTNAITRTAAAAPVTIHVAAPLSGVYITQVASDQQTGVLDDLDIYELGVNVQRVDIAGWVPNVSGVLATTFTLTPCTNGYGSSGPVATCTPDANPAHTLALTSPDPASTTPTASYSGHVEPGATYRLTMKTTLNGSDYASTSILVYNGYIIY